MDEQDEPRNAKERHELFLWNAAIEREKMKDEMNRTMNCIELNLSRGQGTVSDTILFNIFQQLKELNETLKNRQ